MANESTPLFRPGQAVTVLATAAVTGRTFVGVSATRSGSGHVRAATAAQGTKAFGVAARDIGSGEIGTIERAGILHVTAGGAITAGARIEVGAGGKAVALSSGVAVGQALETGVNNNPVLIALKV